MCFNTFQFSNQAFMKRIILLLDPLETCIIRLNEIIYSDKMLSDTCSIIIRTYQHSITPDIRYIPSTFNCMFFANSYLEQEKQILSHRGL